MNSLLIAAAVLCALWAPAGAKKAPRAKSALVAVTETVAQVIKINRILRTVTIKDPKDPPGKISTIWVLPGTKNLDRLKPGAVMHVRYLQGAALAINKPGAAPAFKEETVRLAAKMENPARSC